MKLQPAQIAPDFKAKDVQGNSVQLSSFKGKKVFLTFYRNVGCPVCNLRFHELLPLEKEFKDKGVIVLAIYESSEANLKRYVGNETYYTEMIANPKFDLYEKYAIERSTLKLLSSIYKGVIGKAEQGKKLYKEKFDQDGHANLLGGEFLIDENGKIKTAYYNQFIGDHLPLKDLKAFINS
ncbi:redoxin domain-containing protein [Mucilaginibacter sp. FT3.2]|uniref:redoxin domain-containing protein n=1 Tax=Mucilaginibacter sp. FT3.2 TaxID=2723090 RepID=UPI00160EB3AE|nr:redoxin domain-containing protein [Mucilaginibacter sp. FT3.2]MBB6232757.1 peroxiredoxin [Mucilaginibacter sp. FT3.2]